MEKILYKNARIIDPASDFDATGWLIVAGDLILDFGAGSRDDFDNFTKVVDCGGYILMPGIVDIHVHFRDPGMSSSENIISGAKAAAAGGVTTVVCQPNTDPAIDSPAVVEYVRSVGERACVNIKMYGAVTVKRQGAELTDMYALHDAGVCGFTDDGATVDDAYLLRGALCLSRELNCLIAQHAQDRALSSGASVNEGSVSFAAGERGWPAVAESSVVARDIDIQSHTGGYYHVLHVSAKETLKHVERAKNEGRTVTCEVAPHHFILTDDAIKSCYRQAKMCPPLRDEKNRLAIVDAMKSGIIDCIATDHAPHFDKELQSFATAAPGIIGLETLLPLSLELYHNGSMKLSDILRMLTVSPARLIGDNRIGKLRRDCYADFIIMDHNTDFVVGDKFVSRSRNSPFVGRKMKGKVLATVCRGVNVYCDSQYKFLI